MVQVDRITIHILIVGIVGYDSLSIVLINLLENNSPLRKCVISRIQYKAHRLNGTKEATTSKSGH